MEWTKKLALVITSTIFLEVTQDFAKGSWAQASGNNVIGFQKGMSYTTYANMTPEVLGSAESDESLGRMKQIGVEWVAINVVGWYQSNACSVDIHKNPYQAPTNEALAHAIQRAHNLSMKVMLKPIIDLEDGRWRGEIQPSEAWFQNYTNYINSFAELAQQNSVEIFCFGTELNGTVSCEAEWRHVISNVRQRYSGLLTYAAILDREYDKFVKWWDALDYVGINAYFPLSNISDPTITEIKVTWQKITDYLDSFYSKVNKTIIFTEIGYQAVDGTNIQPWNYSLMFDDKLELDLQEQADCYEAAFQALWNKTGTWLNGIYWWYWQTNPNAAMATYDANYNKTLRDYTPQNKPAQGVLTHWYSQEPIPEFPTQIIPAIFLTTTLLAVLINRKKIRSGSIMGS